MYEKQPTPQPAIEIPPAPEGLEIIHDAVPTPFPAEVSPEKSARVKFGDPNREYPENIPADSVPQLEPIEESSEA